VTQTITIKARFNGPPGCGNGGYVSGRMAAFFDGPAEIRLHAPTPLDAPMEIRLEDGEIRLVQGETLVAKAQPGQLSRTPPAAPGFAAAEDAATRYPGLIEHGLDSCFVCGPARQPEDGLRIFTGPLDESGDLHAAPWRPDGTLLAEDGLIAPEYLWASLDCPSYFALNKPALPALLGRMTGEVISRPEAGEACTVAAWALASEGRKHFSASALYRADGSLAARAELLWIELKPR
jgi:hypothetical protein